MSELYSVSSDTANNQVHESVLLKQILDSSITTTLLGLNVIGDTITITFITSISAPEKITLDSVVNNHQGAPKNETVGDQSNLTGSSSPSVNDDSSMDYSPGSIWIDQTQHNAYLFITGATGNAVWKNITSNIGSKFDAYYDQSPDLIIPSGDWSDIPLDINRVVDASFTHPTGATGVTINETGQYLVMGRCSTQVTSGTSGGTSQLRLVHNGEPVTGTLSTMYNNQSPDGDNSCSFTAVLSLTSADTVNMQIQKFNGAGSTLRLLSEGCSLVILQM